MDLGGSQKVASEKKTCFQPYSAPQTTDQKVDKLARIRENQRRSRARKQEHIRDLEQKLACLQEEAHRKDIEHRLAVQRLELENKKLRSLLSCTPIPAHFIEEYLRAGEDPAVTQKVAIPALRRPEVQTVQQELQNEKQSESQPQSKCQGSNCSRPCSTTSSRAEASSADMINAPVTETKPKLVPESPQRAQPPDVQKPPDCPPVPLCDCSSGDTDCFPVNGDVLNTTLCAIADELIKQYNTRGVDIEEIRKKLWAGFSKGLTSEEGCRVQNQILFQVLDEISNN
ncbi:bZIP transcription factor [Aspergillus clavatus NRRL 1]|uniref:BZIP domain-containing protein n=1 Tax=Aspergillus clavatus (strain ATCC 1007 / CBS 513.65 / DSM 816 / NCTC 3887 / NRRL 1 / QM 1276 / 107) TaxID=344612 RepID=A1CR87_ASPCL|nr:uncharacterized protein ACLA_028830 [Aspergillus clavatus NRRL 1]EAW08158.1 conserved hypothetical protein [Aspergillus clavatus NRRL 1]